MSTSTPDAAAFDAANVFGKGEPNTAYAQFFSGESFLRTLVTAPDCAVGVHNVTFAPGCRNNWHVHHATSGGGQVHRVEDWGRRQLAYQINKLSKAHYLCLNIEAGRDVMDELEHAFRFNDAVLRHLTVQKAKAETGPSSMMKTVEREEARKAQQTAEQAAG